MIIVAIDSPLGTCQIEDTKLEATVLVSAHLNIKTKVNEK